MLPIDSRAEREARRIAKEKDAQTNSLSVFDESDQSTTSLATSPPTERTCLSTLTGNDIGTSVDLSSESSTSSFSPNQNAKLSLPPRFKEWIKGSMNAGSPYSDSASDDLHLNTVVTVDEQEKGEGQVKTDRITSHSTTNQVITSNYDKVEPTCDMSGVSPIDTPIHSVSTDNISSRVCDALSNLNNSGGDDGERFNFQSPSCDSSDDGDDSSTDTPDFCPTAPSMQSNLIQYVEPPVGWRGDNSTNKSPQIVHRLVQRHTCGGTPSSPPQHAQVAPRNPALQKICDNLSPRQPNRLPPGQVLHQTSVQQPQRKIAGPFFAKAINTTEHPHVPQQANRSPKKVLTFAENLPTKHSHRVFDQSQLSNLRQPPDRHVHGVSLQENVVFDCSPPRQVINTQQPQGQLKFEQDLRSPAFSRQEQMPSDSSQLADRRVAASVDMRPGHMTQARRSNAEFESLVEKLQIASRRLKEKVSETHGTKQELESTRVRMQHCEGQLVTLKTTLERSQKELKDSQHERMNMEQELFSLQQQLDSLRNATSCAACVTKVPASELKYVMDTMSASNVELTSCPHCKQKDAELKKISQQLEILYKSTRISEAGLNGQQSFMELENRRLLNERNSAREKLKTIRQEFDKQQSYLENENKVRQETLKVENEKLAKELKKARSDVEGLKAITRKQEADSTTFMNASLRDENATLKNENVQIRHELQNLREQLDFSLMTPLPEVTKNSWQEANKLLSAKLAQAAEEMKQLQEMNKQLNVNHLAAQQEVKKLRDQLQLSADAFNAEKLTDELRELQQKLEAALEENRKLEENLSKAYEEGEALRISDTQTASVTTQVKMDTQSHVLLKKENELLTSKLKDSTIKKSRSTEAKLESVSSSLLKNENADLASKLKESIRKDFQSRSTEARLESESVSALRKAHNISARKEFQTQSTEARLESVSCSSLRKENEDLTFKIKELVKERPRQSQHVEAKLESVSAGELRRENEDLALKLKDLRKKGSQRVQFTEAKLDTDSYMLLKQQKQKLPFNIQESLSTQVVFSCENCSFLRYENERLHADLKTFDAAVSDGVSASTLATDSFSALRSENAQLAAQLEETKRELTQTQERFASLVRNDDSTSLVSHTDKSENVLVPMISAPLLTSSHSRTPPDDPRSEKADQEISDLTEKLMECNKLRQTASGEMNRMMAEWEKERTITSEQQQKTIDEKNAELERLHNELRQLEGSSTVGDCQALAEENNVLRRQINHLQDDLDLLKQQSAASPEADEVSRLKTRISQLEAELESLHEKYTAAEAAKEREGRKDLELNRLQHELGLARKDIELYQKGQSPCGSTAYVVRMRDQTIVGLHKKIAEMERFSQQCRDSGFSPRSKASTPRREISPKRDDATEMLVIMTDETARMKESIDKLESDNVKLIELIKQRDAKIFEMEDEIEWLIKGSTQQDMITVYTQKLKEGEEEMGKLHQSMEVLTKKHSNLLIADSSEGLDKQTNYTRQLTQLILNSLGADRPLETDMRKLLNELDNLEKKNFELAKALREYERVKAEQLPKLRNDLEELRRTRNDLRGEFDDCNQKLKLAQRDIDALRKEKMDLLKNHEVAMSSKRDEMAAIASRLEVNESNLQGMMRQKDAENLRLRDELNHLTAVVSERDGALTHWKIKCEDINRQMADMEERHSLVVKAKNKEIKTLTSQVGELAEQMDKASSVNDPELFRLQSQLKEAQRQHSDILEQNETTLKLKEEEMRRLYSEIGDMSAHLHTINKDKETEIQRLRKEVSLLKEERNNMLADSQATMEEKQAEIRKLMVNLEKMEVEAATQRAKKEQEMTLLQAEFDQKIEKISADRAHMVAVKDNEVHNLKQEVERLLNDARDGGSSIAGMRRQIFHLEHDKSELLLLKDQWQSDMDKLYTEYEICRNDRADFEEMVDRLSKEMEERVEGLRQEHKEILKVKDAQIRELYIKVEKIARERGDMSAHLHRVLQEKERKIAELFEKLEEYDRCLDSAEHSFKIKLQKKSEEIRWLREEIHKMGEEGLRLLQLREREIMEMRAHLTNMLKVMNQKSRARVSSHVMITRPAKVTVSEPHLRTARPPRPQRAGRAGMASSHIMRTPTASRTKRR